MRVCSFLPAATEIIYALGLEESLCGVTFECLSDLPKVVRSTLEQQNFNSLEIDEFVSKSKSRGDSLYYIDESLLSKLKPDVIFTQDVCQVCQIETAQVQKAVHQLEQECTVVPLLPKTLEDVYANIETIANIMGHGEKGKALVSKQRERTQSINDVLISQQLQSRKVLFLEWFNPLYNCGHWIPDQIEMAGGFDQLSCPSDYSHKIDWVQVKVYNPEILVIAPCGLSIETSITEITQLQNLEGWRELNAVKNGEVYILNGDLFTCPGVRLIDGIEVLAALFHPQHFNFFREQHAEHFVKMTAI